MGKAARRVHGESQKHIIRLLEGLSGRYSRWEIWQDFIIMSAISLANAIASFSMAVSHSGDTVSIFSPVTFCTRK